MRKYTKDELVAAMALYNQRAVDHPEEFSDYKEKPPEEVAARQVDYLLSLVP